MMAKQSSLLGFFNKRCRVEQEETPPTPQLDLNVMSASASASLTASSAVRPRSQSDTSLPPPSSIPSRPCQQGKEKGK